MSLLIAGVLLAASFYFEYRKKKDFSGNDTLIAGTLFLAAMIAFFIAGAP